MQLKKSNVVPIHKKDDKHTIENYCPISVPPIDGKIFECLLYHTVLIFFSKNNLLSSNQPGYRLGDSCINQLLSVNHEILSVFDMGLEVCGKFLDIFKAFGKVWHEGLISKFRQNCISSEIINILEDFLSARKQKVF